jgi:hypothetical protein
VANFGRPGRIIVSGIQYELAKFIKIGISEFVNNFRKMIEIVKKIVK